MLIGELSFGRELRPVRGAILFAATAKEAGLAGIIVPEANGAEAAAIPGIDVRCAETLGEVVTFLSGRGFLADGLDCEAVRPAEDTVGLGPGDPLGPPPGRPRHEDGRWRAGSPATP
jgi:magnesium chelatase family protein